LLNPIYWGEPEALKRRSIPVEKTVRHLYRKRVRLVPRPAEERVTLPSTIAPALVSKELAERVHARLAQNQYFAPRNNHQPDASYLRGLVYCGVCGAHMTILNEPNRGQRRRDTGPQFRCHTGTRILGRIGKCRTGGNTIMAAKLDATAWAEMIRLFQAPGELTAELQAARAQAAAQHTEAAQPVDDLTTRIADAERRLASLRNTTLTWVHVVCGCAWATSGSAWSSGSTQVGAAAGRSGRTGHPPGPRWCRTGG